MASSQMKMIVLALVMGFHCADAFIDRIVPKGHTGKCMDLDSGDTTNGKRLMLWDCHGSEEDNQYREYQEFLLGDSIIYKKDITKCVDYKTYGGNGPANGDHLQIWDCKDQHPHKWFYNFEDSTIRLSADGKEMCLSLEREPTDGEDGNGNRLIVWECHEHSTQWALADDHGNLYTGEEEGNLEFVIPIVILSILLAASLLYNCCQRWRMRKAAKAECNVPSPGHQSPSIGREHAHLEETTSESSSRV